MTTFGRCILNLFIVGLIATPAYAAKTFATAPYLKTCDGFLTAIENDDIESFFMDQAQTLAERVQVLLDYGLVYNKEYANAVVTTLQRGLLARNPRMNAMKIRTMRLLPAVMRRFASEVLAEFEREVARVATTDEGQARLARTRQFRAALLRRADRAEWLNAYAAAVRLSFMHVMRTYREWAKDKSSAHILTFTGGAATVGIPFAEYMLRLNPPTYGVGFAETFAFGYFGLMGGGAVGLVAAGVEAAYLHLSSPPAVPPTVLSRGTPVTFADPKQHRDQDYRPSPSLAQITPANLSAFTPVDLAYAGDLELRQFEYLLNANAKFDARALDHDLARVSERSRQLAADWTDPRARLRYAATINDLIEIFDELQGNLRGRLRAGRELLDTLKTQIDRVGRVPLDATSAHLNDERVLKQELLMLRHRYAVDTLMQVRIEDRATADLAQRIEPLLAELKRVLSPAPSSIADWQGVVGRAESVSARITQTLAGVPRLERPAEEPID